MSIKVLCLTEDVHRYKDYARRFGVDFTPVASIPDLIDALSRSPHNGIVLEVKKMLRASSHEKNVLQEIVESFPTLRVAVTPESDQLKALGGFECFFGKTCVQFKARAVRKNIRISVHLPILLARVADPDFAKAEKSHTMNVSEGGAFLYATSDWSAERWVLVRFIDIKDPTPVLLHIRWFRPWGAGIRLSGLGAKYGHIGVEQHRMLCSRFLLKQHVEPPDRNDLPAGAETLAKKLGLDKGSPHRG